jgi:ornithine cyclodeaminase
MPFNTAHTSSATSPSRSTKHPVGLHLSQSSTQRRATVQHSHRLLAERMVSLGALGALGASAPTGLVTSPAAKAASATSPNAPAPALTPALTHALTPASGRTRMLRPQDVAAIVRQRGLFAVLRDLTNAIERDFLRWNEFDKTPRVASHSHLGVVELMPTADATHYSFKYVNGHPGNTRWNLPTVMAFGVLAEVRTGLPMLLSELTLTTALRTAATSAMAARALARPNSRVMALIGNGAQSEFQAAAFAAVLGIKHFKLFDVDAQASAKLARNLAALGLQAQVCASAREAVAGADVVTTATADKTNATIVTAQMLEPGMHINAVGGDCPGKTELAADVLKTSRVFVEFEPQTRLEGDLQQMPASFQVTELWQVLSNQAPGRQRPSDVTVFDSVGFAIEDFSALNYLHAAATELNLGEFVDLLPNNADPKDLFSVLG